MVELVGFRISSWDTPFWIGPNRWARRFNKRASGPVQYWSLHPQTPWAEILRGHGIRTADDARELRQRVWASRIRLPELHDVSFENAPEHGLEPHQLVSDDYGACQEFGDRCLRDPGWPKAIRVPSAALPGTNNLVLFGPRVAVPYSLEPLSPEDTPASIAAEQAEAPPELIPFVRHYDDEHAALAAWRRGKPFRFVEPAVAPLD